MVDKIDTGFDVLAKNLEIPVFKSSILSTRQNEVEKLLHKNLEIAGTVLPGAYTRNTLTSPLVENVVDMYVTFKTDLRMVYKPTALLEKVYECLVEKYPDVEIDKNKNVKLKVDEFSFNVVPAFINVNGGNVIPDMFNKKWVNSDPSIFHDLLIEENKKHNGRLLPVIRMVKCWNRSIGGIFREYYLELLVTDILKDLRILSYQDTVRHIFKKGLAQVIFTIDDPAAAGTQMEGLANVETLVYAMNYFYDAYEMATHAQKMEEEGENTDSYKEWAKLFPGNFPTPMHMLIQQMESSDIQGAKALKIMRDMLQKGDKDQGKD